MLNKYLPAIQKLTGILRRYMVMICIIAFGCLYGYLVYTAGQQAEIEPSEHEISAAYQGVNRAKFDESVADKMRQLESSNISVQALFEAARSNPFAE